MVSFASSVCAVTELVRRRRRRAGERRRVTMSIHGRCACARVEGRARTRRKLDINTTEGPEELISNKRKLI